MVGYFYALILLLNFNVIYDKYQKIHAKWYVIKQKLIILKPKITFCYIWRNSAVNLYTV